MRRAVRFPTAVLADAGPRGGPGTRSRRSSGILTTSATSSRTTRWRPTSARTAVGKRNGAANDLERRRALLVDVLAQERPQLRSDLVPGGPTRPPGLLEERRGRGTTPVAEAAGDGPLDPARQRRLHPGGQPFGVLGELNFGEPTLDRPTLDLPTLDLLSLRIGRHRRAPGRGCRNAGPPDPVSPTGSPQPATARPPPAGPRPRPAVEGHLEPGGVAVVAHAQLGEAQGGAARPRPAPPGRAGRPTPACRTGTATPGRRPRACPTCAGPSRGDSARTSALVKPASTSGNARHARRRPAAGPVVAEVVGVHAQHDLAPPAAASGPRRSIRADLQWKQRSPSLAVGGHRARR